MMSIAIYSEDNVMLNSNGAETQTFLSHVLYFMAQTLGYDTSPVLVS